MKPTLTWWGAFQTKRFQQSASTRRALLIVSYNRQVKRIFSAVMSRPESMFDWLGRPSLLKTDPSRCSVGSTALRKKCLYSELFWSAFSRIRTQYGEIQSMRENVDHDNPEYGHLSHSAVLPLWWVRTAPEVSEEKGNTSPFYRWFLLKV